MGDGMSQAWECPRCKRINAPFNPSCFCNEELKINEKEIVFKQEMHNYSQQTLLHCTICGGYHGMFGGQPIQCAKLMTEV